MKEKTTLPAPKPSARRVAISRERSATDQHHFRTYQRLAFHARHSGGVLQDLYLVERDIAVHFRG